MPRATTLSTGLILISLAACASAPREQTPPIVQPGPPGEASRTISRREAATLPVPGVTAADIAFMQGMIAHHAQALEMVALLQTRTESDAMNRMAQRIAVSQADEIVMMREWLEAQGVAAPSAHADHAHDATLMPGMLTPAEMQRLAATKGREFDRLFLEGMIRHHQGALVMVRDLFASPGAAQGAEIFAFASDVDADQRMEIGRMVGMLKEFEK
jgi:uncharacterized protein (DUF305 family)